MISKAELCPELFEFFTRHHRPGRIGFVGTTDAVGTAIRDAQSRITLDGTPSRWSHVFLMGEERADGEIYIFESDLEPDFDRPQFRNGAQESRLRKWSVDAVEHAAVLEISGAEDRVSALQAAALQFVYGQQVAYPIMQLVGTWWQIVAARVWRANPFQEATALYCSSFVRHCFDEVGIRLTPNHIHLSNTAPEHLWQTTQAAERYAWRRRESSVGHA
ncbi:hypothetical protein JXA88_08630 [Candidatus Fermentibacteria bacterium]|nr:hypothetical protein [Candidatus Fermentibacteria bacterium]